MEEKLYGYFGKKPVYGSRDNWIYTVRGFGPIESDKELMEYAEKVTWGWADAGWKRRFEDFYLSDYALAHPYSDRLKQLQKEARAAEKAADDAREWRLDRTVYYADNSVEEIWIDKNGEEKTVMTVGPHGDAC